MEVVFSHFSLDSLPRLVGSLRLPGADGIIMMTAEEVLQILRRIEENVGESWAQDPPPDAWPGLELVA